MVFDRQILLWSLEFVMFTYNHYSLWINPSKVILSRLCHSCILLFLYWNWNSTLIWIIMYYTFCFHEKEWKNKHKAIIDLLPSVHHFNRCFNILDLIHGVFWVNVLPVVTVSDPVAVALPVSSHPGDKHRHVYDICPRWRAPQRLGSGGESRSISNQTSWGFMRLIFFPCNELQFKSEQRAFQSRGNYVRCPGN